MDVKQTNRFWCIWKILQHGYNFFVCACQVILEHQLLYCDEEVHVSYILLHLITTVGQPVQMTLLAYCTNLVATLFVNRYNYVYTGRYCGMYQLGKNWIFSFMLGNYNVIIELFLRKGMNPYFPVYSHLTCQCYSLMTKINMMKTSDSV